MKLFTANISIIFFLFLSFAKPSFAKNYTDYHKAINKAEEAIFVKNKIAEGLKIYAETFAAFDFVYAGDCRIALQIALYHNDEKAFLSFTKKAFENGLMLRNFRKMYFVKRQPIYQKDSLQIEALYKTARPHYLARIDTTSLKKMYLLFVDDQLVKNRLKYPDGRYESERDYQKRYRPLIAKTMAEIQNIINEKGFLGDKLLGLGQRDIMRELKLNAPDMEEYWWRNKNRADCSIYENQFQIEEYSLCNHLIFPILIHYDHFLDIYKEDFVRKQIALGNVNPKDFAYLSDFENDYSNTMNPIYKTNTCYFGVGVRPNKMTPNSLFVPDSIINQCRAKWFIAPIENDRAKWQFMTEHKMDFGFGYVGTRS